MRKIFRYSSAIIIIMTLVACSPIFTAQQELDAIHPGTATEEADLINFFNKWRYLSNTSDWQDASKILGSAKGRLADIQYPKIIKGDLADLAFWENFYGLYGPKGIAVENRAKEIRRAKYKAVQNPKDFDSADWRDYWAMFSPELSNDIIKNPPISPKLTYVLWEGELTSVVPNGYVFTADEGEFVVASPVKPHTAIRQGERYLVFGVYGQNLPKYTLVGQFLVPAIGMAVVFDWEPDFKKHLINGRQ